MPSKSPLSGTARRSTTSAVTRQPASSRLTDVTDETFNFSVASVRNTESITSLIVSWLPTGTLNEPAAADGEAGSGAGTIGGGGGTKGDAADDGGGGGTKGDAADDGGGGGAGVGHG